MDRHKASDEPLVGWLYGDFHGEAHEPKPRTAACHGRMDPDGRGDNGVVVR
jgi:hypothetical protein